MKFYLAKGWKVFLYLLTATLFVVTVLQYLSPYWSLWQYKPEDYAINCAIATVFLILLAIAVYYGEKSYYEIGEDRVVSTGPLYRKEILFERIKGYRMTEEGMTLESMDKKRLKLSKYTGDKDELFMWFSLRYQNLDEVEQSMDRAEILSDTSHGETLQERTSNYDRAAQVCQVLNWGSLILTVAVVLFLPDHPMLISLMMLIPFVVLFVMFKFKGMVRLNEKNFNSKVPNVMLAIFSSTLGASMLVLTGKSNLVDYRNILVIAVVIALVMLLMFAKAGPDFEFRTKDGKFVVIFYSILLYAYAFGLTGYLNCALDTSSPTERQAKVNRKELGGKKFFRTRTLFVVVSDKDTSGDSYNVSTEVFDKTEPGQMVTLVQRSGALGAAWELVK